jgi:hypothetical protein
MRRPGFIVSAWFPVGWCRRMSRAWGVIVLLLAVQGLGLREVRSEGTVATNSTAALLQALLGGGRVQLTFPETLTLEIPLLIAADTVLEGAVAGGRLATLSGANLRRPFHVLPGIRFEIRNCVIREGLSTNGGGIYNEGILIASNVVFAACKAVGPDGATGAAGESRFGVGGNGRAGTPGLPGRGGAIDNLGEVTLVDCILSSNAAQGGRGGNGGDGGTGTWANGIGGDGAPGAEAYGGAIHGRAGSQLTVTNTLFASNTVKAGDGGEGGSDSSVLGSGHGARGANAAGGAIHTEGWLRVVRSAFATNSVTGGKAAPAGAPSVSIGKEGASGGHAWGGALASWSTGVVINSSFVTNTVVGGDGGKGAAGQFTAGKGGSGGDGLGGSIHGKGSLAMTHVTLAWNSVTNGAGGAGGAALPGTAGRDGKAAGSGIAADGSGVSVLNSIVVAAGGLSTLEGGVQDLGHNLFSDKGTGRAIAGSLYSASPGFTEFRVWTSLTTPGFLLLPGSLAIDAADRTSATTEDQRGLPRPAGLGPDMGAMEVASSSFVIQGRVLVGSGTVGIPGVVLEVGDLRQTTDASGSFEFGPLPAGFYTVAIAGGGIGFTPRLVQIPLIADATGVVFRSTGMVLSYQPEGALPGMGIVTATGIPGLTHRLEASADLRQWTTVGTAVPDAQGRLEFRHDSGSAPTLFYRIVAD